MATAWHSLKERQLPRKNHMDISSDLATLGLLGTGLSQHARMITLASAQARGLPDSLMAERLTGREAVNELFLFEVDALSVSTDLDLSIFLGEELTVGLLQPDGSRRSWHGICMHAAWRGADGGVARYRLRLAPGLALLTYRRDSYIFQDKNVQEVVSELLADYPQVRFGFDITQPMARRSIVTQYRESDFDFLTRLLASEGLNWRFEHDQAGADDSADGDGHARHRVVFFDSEAFAPATPGGDCIRFHGVRATDTDDAIDEFHSRRQVQANAVSISSWDPDQLVAPAAEQHSHLDAGELPDLPVHDGSGERIASDAGAPDSHSELMLKALELENKSFAGAGAVRRLAAGHAFDLLQHERFADGEARFKVLWVEHEARNNVGSQIKGAPGAVEAGTYRNSFACVRDAVSIVPRATAAPHASTALGPQTALVVGLPNAISTTNRDHRVKVQFAWQRGVAANAGGATHSTDEKGNAPGDDTSGFWVRVAEALAGPNWGSQFTPRIGTEVLIDFIEGDMDRPLLVAQLYTGSDLPPFSAGLDSGANHGGTLSGIHSHNFDGVGFNQWQIDDAAGQLRTRLASSTAATQLNLGYLIAQNPLSGQRGGYRGAGFELRTDAWGVVRGGEGVLLTTTARAQQGSGVSSTQMDAAEALSLMRRGSELAATLGQSAKAQNALSSGLALESYKQFMTLIDPGQKGRHAAAVNRQDAFKPAQGTRELDKTKPVEGFGAAIVLMDAPASISLATPASTAIYAGECMQWTTQSDLHMAAQYTVSQVAATAAGLYSHSGGIQALAANGPVSLQANTDQLEILSDEKITIVSAQDSIEIKGSSKIVLQAGQASITLEGGNITFACPGNFTVKGGLHPFEGGAQHPASMTQLPSSTMGLFNRKMQLTDQETGEIVPDSPYFIRMDNGVVYHGTTDAEGHTEMAHDQTALSGKAYFGHEAMKQIAKFKGNS